MNTPEIAVIAFTLGIIAGAILEARYGTKVASTVSADITKIKSDVAEIKARAEADVKAAAAKI